MTIIFLGICIIVLLVLLKAILISSKERFLGVPEYMKYRSKCYSCEKDLINRYNSTDFAYLGQPTKGFSEERELIQRTGFIGAAFGAHPL